MNIEDEKSIIEKMHKRRIELNLSFQDLALRTGLSKSTLQRYETGKIKNIPLDKLKVLASGLEVDPKWIIGLDDSSNNHCIHNSEEQLLLSDFDSTNEITRLQYIISRRRNELNLTYEEIGNVVGVSKSTVRKWETGMIKNMKKDKILLLAKSLNISPSFLLETEKEYDNKIKNMIFLEFMDLTEEEQYKVLEYTKFIKSLRESDDK